MTYIRRAQSADLPELTRLFDAYRIFYKKEGDLTAAERFLQERLEHGESEIFVAAEDDNLVGFTQLYPLFSSVRMQRIWLLNDLYVQPAHRGKGISKGLLHAAKEWARSTGAAGLLLETEKVNVIGNKLYPSAGFELYDETNFYWWANR